MLLTMRFLHAARSLPPDAIDQAERTATPIMYAHFDLVTVLGGAPDEVAALCDRLLPGHVDAATLDQVVTQDATEPYGRLP